MVVEAVGMDEPHYAYGRLKVTEEMRRFGMLGEEKVPGRGSAASVAPERPSRMSLENAP